MDERRVVEMIAQALTAERERLAELLRNAAHRSFVNDRGVILAEELESLAEDVERVADLGP